MIQTLLKIRASIRLLLLLHLLLLLQRLVKDVRPHNRGCGCRVRNRLRWKYHQFLLSRHRGRNNASVFNDKLLLLILRHLLLMGVLLALVNVAEQVLLGHHFRVVLMRLHLLLLENLLSVIVVALVHST